MRVIIGRNGQCPDYTGAHVSLVQDGRHYLGQIAFQDPDEHLCAVTHFDGSPWPFLVAVTRLEILERTYVD